MLAQRFTIDPTPDANGKVRVRDMGVLTTGHFHTAPQAQAWIDQRVDRLIRASAPSGMPGRARAHLITPALLDTMLRNGQPDAGY